MASDLLSIAASGARTARGALAVTAQNIANAASEGYVRRSATMAEVAASGGPGRTGDISLSGSRIAAIRRNADPFAQAEVRRTHSDLARASAELGGLRNSESALESAGIHGAVVEFEAALQHLAGDPVDPARRAQVLADAGTLANSFAIAASGLAFAAEGLRTDAAAAGADIALIASELARTNVGLARAGAGSSDRASLLDQRDRLLERLSGHINLATAFAPDGGVTVAIGSNPPRQLVAGANASAASLTVRPDGTLQLAIDNQPTEAAGGTLSGAGSALGAIAGLRDRLDTLARAIAETVNGVQAGGAAIDGSAGQPLFAGTTASDLRVVLASGDGIATAPVGAAAGSRDPGNLTALRQALGILAPAADVNRLLFDISGTVASRALTHSALETIASAAQVTLQEQAGVDLDTEAANLVRFQQAFQASGRAMQTASDIFDTLLGIGR